MLCPKISEFCVPGVAEIQWNPKVGIDFFFRRLDCVFVVPAPFGVSPKFMKLYSLETTQNFRGGAKIICFYAIMLGIGPNQILGPFQTKDIIENDNPFTESLLFQRKSMADNKD